MVGDYPGCGAFFRYYGQRADLTKRRSGSKLTAAKGEVAQRWSRGLISLWLWVQVPPSPSNPPPVV